MKTWERAWINGTVATFDETGLIEKGAVVMQDGELVWLGKTSDCSLDQVEEVIDVEGALITPSLIDCHTHLVYAGDRSNEFEMRLDGKSYKEIAEQGGGIKATVTATREASEDELFVQSMMRAEKLYQDGVGIVEIKSGYGLDLETELKMLRVAKRIDRETPLEVVTTFLGAHALPFEYDDKPDEYIDLICNTMIPEVAKQGLADCVDVFCENIGFSLEQTKRVFDAAKKHGLNIKCHAEQLSNLGGSKLAASMNALSCDHLEYLDEAGVKAMADYGTVAVLLPGAFYFLNETKKPPIDLFRKYNVPMAIATDSNPGSSPTTNLKLMMNMACTLFGLTIEEAWRGVTVNAAKALGLPESVAQLKLNQKASFIVWDETRLASVISQF